MNAPRNLLRDVRMVLGGADRADLLLAVAAVLVGVLTAVLGLAGILDDRVLLRSVNAWFDADTPRVVANMLSRVSDQSRNYVHPLFPLATLPLTKVLLKTGLSDMHAVYAVVCLYAGLWSGLVFALLRASGARRTDAVVFWVLTHATAAAVFWGSTPETWLVGSVSLLVTLLLAALAARLTQLESWMVLGGVLSIGITVTNFMVAVVAMVRLLPFRRAVVVGCKAVCACVVLWWLEAVAIRTLGVPFRSVAAETGFLSEQGFMASALDRIRSFFLHSIVLPTPETIVFYWQRGLSVQNVSVSSLTVPHMAALVGWVLLLALGVVGAFRARATSRFPDILVAAILGQLALHLVFGDETFLYSMHFTPMLVVLASYAARSKARPVVLAGTLVLAAFAMQHNVRQRTVARRTAHEIMLATRPAREVLSDAMRTFPAADWPRGDQHVVLALAGAPASWRGYHEPGGSFSPGFGTFGVSIVVRDRAGRVVTTSNRVAPDSVQETLAPELDGIETTTRWYRSRWTALPGRRFRLHVEPAAGEATLGIRVSGAGPAGGAVQRLQWQSPCLLVNDAWRACVVSGEASVRIDSETLALDALPAAASTTDVHEFSDGFGAALLLPARADSVVIELSPVTAGDDTPITVPAASALRAVVRGLDPRFEAILRAQHFHLRSSDGRDHPADGQVEEASVRPFERTRDGAYAVAALARLGDVALATERARALEAVDVGGAAGAEADAPALALWALDELRRYARDTAFARRVWPHVLRKARIVERSTLDAAPFFLTPAGPIDWSRRQQTARELSMVSRGVYDGLVIGRIDGQEMTVANNALAHVALQRAAAFAAALGRRDDVVRFSLAADTLQARWLRSYRRAQDRTTPHALATGLWPGAIAMPDRAGYRQLLEPATTGGMRPEFVIGRAQQWLRLDEPARAWSLLDTLLQRTGTTTRAFAIRETDPRVGGYGQWDSERGEVDLREWDRIRGGARTTSSGPLTGAAALTALTVLDMLASESVERDGTTTIRIGAGVQPTWLRAPVEVSGLRFPEGELGWSWDGSVVTVRWTGPNTVRFTLGPAFPRGTRLQVSALR